MAMILEEVEIRLTDLICGHVHATFLCSCNKKNLKPEGSGLDGSLYPRLGTPRRLLPENRPFLGLAAPRRLGRAWPLSGAELGRAVLRSACALTYVQGRSLRSPVASGAVTGGGVSGDCVLVGRGLQSTLAYLSRW